MFVYFKEYSGMFSVIAHNNFNLHKNTDLILIINNYFIILSIRNGDQYRI